MGKESEIFLKTRLLGGYRPRNGRGLQLGLGHQFIAGESFVHGTVPLAPPGLGGVLMREGSAGIFVDVLAIG